MGRHADTSAARRSLQLTPQVLIALAVAAVVLLAGGITWWAVGAGSGDWDRTAVVRVAVAPELAPVAEQVLADAEGLRPEDCASAEVTAQQPVQTVGDLGALDAGDLPHLWVPDSSLWAARAGVGRRAGQPAGHRRPGPRDQRRGPGRAERRPDRAGRRRGRRQRRGADRAR